MEAQTGVMTSRPFSNMQVLLILTLLLQVAKPLPPNRHKRHSDSLFTSELSKLRRTAVARNVINSILEAQMSSNTGKVKRHLSDGENSTRPGSPATLRNVPELHAALQLPEGSEVYELSLRNPDVSAVLGELLRLRGLTQQPCLRWFRSYYRAMRILSDGSHWPAAVLIDHQTCVTIRQLAINQQLQTFLTTMDFQ
ncbi:uncharacterized protein LOC119956275 isoform X2 [Scyliorhinus canicula]|uniref:uncharacterized protein LOC119956275 isoform X2 n=1 Tax=Scyliorhinus canicula TaxID=7830 RepID=UPI0018F79F0B|nr:uncharacterized protein LOC119956275 isoform X2 [Scyliorhinus canicula]